MTLLFIDTNIFLDFYRQVGRESNLSILKHIGRHQDRIITTRQVEMEFKKNRPRVIAKSLTAIKSPDWAQLKLPAYLARSGSGLSTGRQQIEELVKTIHERGRRVFEKPTRSDPVYKVAQRLFEADSPYNLSRSKEKDQRKAFRLAWRRFLLGYPPRKSTDTAVGDAVNWEWVVDCAKQADANVVIVSRDSDYGITLKGGVYINDWLAQEFKERVNRRRTVTLTDRLSEGFKQISIEVTQKEAKAEEEFLELQSTAPPQLGEFLSLGLGSPSSEIGGLSGAGSGTFFSELMRMHGPRTGPSISVPSVLSSFGLVSPRKGFTKRSAATHSADEEENG